MTSGSQRVVGNVVDVLARRVFAAEVLVVEGRISAIEPVDAQPSTYLLPGFIDAHVHVESSMLVPSEFARAAVVHGTVATVSDPHEIGNVLGVAGVEYMLDNAAKVPFKFYFGAPSCVPATTFETSGAEITVGQVEQLLDDPRILYLSEMMNFPGVLNNDPGCMAKIAAAQQRGKPVDGHAPGLRGEEAARYIAAGISTDHECFTKEEALDKIAAGAMIAIREGSAARNFDALYTLIGEYPQQTMLCSDDKHPDELVAGHINALVRRAVERGIDLFDALRVACLNPIDHYSLNVGQLRVGDQADFIEVDSLESFVVQRTWIDGKVVAERGTTTIPRVEPPIENYFEPTLIEPGQLSVPFGNGMLQVIEALDGQLITNRLSVQPTIVNGRDDCKVIVGGVSDADRESKQALSASGDASHNHRSSTLQSSCVNGEVISDVSRNILKMVVVNRYRPASPAVAFIKNFGLERGAMASSVAHDSHNVIAVGVSDDDLSAAINAVMECRGGLSAVCEADGIREVLPLPVAGLMATGTCGEVAAAYQRLDAAVKSWGSSLRAPYMTLSFMALLVIPELKLSDQGLFDGGKFEFTPLLA